ncbi:MAG: pyruvate ferredoxin oxidoreductase, partial [Candidatus Woesearchaeota archaeon]|nr:pyruvate ferredoxin oxidoreductase [Candidatus Woesearchaeota archaeon]
MKKVIEASDAVATAVKMCRPSVIPVYPITPQTHIVERLSKYVNNGELDSEMIDAESEHSAISAAMGASACGTRVFTATASQGLALMHEILFIVSGMRLPVVMAVANRTLSAPINIWNDQQDSISARDSGWIQLYVESAQEAFDTTIMAYKIAENRKVLTPVMVCLDGFTLSHVFEPVDIPEQRKVDSFLPKYSPLYSLDVKKPMSFGPIGFPNTFMGFKKMQQDAINNSASVIKSANDEFEKEFSRSYGDGL